MKPLSCRPKWWALVVLLAVFVGILAGESLWPAPTAGHEVLLIGAVLGVYLAMMIWIFANGEAVQNEEDLHHDAAAHGRQMPITERQALYRLAMIRRTGQMETRNDHHDKTT